jgi:RNA polymerase sigma factor (sigma-70 family)
MGGETGQGATLAEIEAVYRADFERFATVAAAICRSQFAARDAVQEAFATAVRKRRQFRGVGSLEGWLWHLVVSQARTQRRRVAGRAAAEFAAAHANGQPGDDSRSDEAAGLIAALPERQRLVVFLRYYADLSYDQIAEAVGVKRGTVAATLNSGHASLRAMLEEVAG